MGLWLIQGPSIFPDWESVRRTQYPLPEMKVDQIMKSLPLVTPIRQAR